MVELERKKLGDLLQNIECNKKSGNLAIPEYQRIYCWPEKNVRLLLDDLLLAEHSKHAYHLGTIILQHSEDKWNIIDGQQRMVTISILLQELGDGSSSLLNENFLSRKANDFIAYNRFLIRSFITRQGWNAEDRIALAEKLKDNTSFDVLFLTSESLDLAYTFFSAQNDRGKPLTDYELLKSHHLRYIPWEEQQMHLAQKWDKLLLEHEQEDGDQSVSIVVGFYLFCLRKWTMMDVCDPDAPKAVKNEFEAAPIVDAVPPFGESFYYNEAIQGGSHFFAYVETFERSYQLFIKTNVFRSLWSTISCSGTQPHTDENGHVRLVENKKRTHWWFGDVIATFLFAYYLKFGEEYIAEAATCITRIISDIRYQKSKANMLTLLQYAGESKIILTLNRATSPTFFLAILKNKISSLPPVGNFYTNAGNKTIRDDYKSLEKSLNQKLSQDYILDFKPYQVK